MKMKKPYPLVSPNFQQSIQNNLIIYNQELQRMFGYEIPESKPIPKRRERLYLQGKKRVSEILQEQKFEVSRKMTDKYVRGGENKENEIHSQKKVDIYQIKISNGQYYRYVIPQKALRTSVKKKKKQLIGKNKSQINFKQNEPNFLRNQKLNKICRSFSQNRIGSSAKINIPQKNMFPEYGKITNIGLKIFKMPFLRQKQRISIIRGKNSHSIHENSLKLNILPERDRKFSKHLITDQKKLASSSALIIQNLQKTQSNNYRRMSLYDKYYNTE